MQYALKDTLQTNVKRRNLTLATERDTPKKHQLNKLCEIDHELLDSLLEGYDNTLRRFLYLGITQGFMMHAKNVNERAVTRNHTSATNNPKVVHEKLRKELSKGYIAGPFTDPPFENFVVSPIALVPKKEQHSFRLIHNLSYPPNNSVNSSIPSFISAVSYETIHQVIQLVLECGAGH